MRQDPNKQRCASGVAKGYFRAAGCVEEGFADIQGDR